MKKKYRHGMTLVELIITVAILAIISLVALSVFSNGYYWINKLGGKSEKLFYSQGKLEDGLIKKKGTTFYEVALIEDSLIPDGMQKEDVTVRGALLQEGDLTTFVSKVSALDIRSDNKDQAHLYGNSPAQIEYKLNTVNMPAGSRVRIELLGQDKKPLTPKIEAITTITTVEQNDQGEDIAKDISLSLNLPINYTHQLKPGIYYVSLTAEDPAGKALLYSPYRSLYTVKPITYVGGGDEGLITFSGGENIFYKNKEFSASGDIRSIAYGGDKEKVFVVVGTDGLLAHSTDGLNWSKITSVPNTVNFKKVITGGSNGQLFVALAEKQIYYSVGGKDGWIKLKDKDTEGDYADIAWDPDGKLFVMKSEILQLQGEPCFYIVGQNLGVDLLSIKDKEKKLEYQETAGNAALNSFDWIIPARAKEEGNDKLNYVYMIKEENDPAHRLNLLISFNRIIKDSDGSIKVEYDKSTLDYPTDDKFVLSGSATTQFSGTGDDGKPKKSVMTSFFHSNTAESVHILDKNDKDQYTFTKLNNIPVFPGSKDGYQIVDVDSYSDTKVLVVGTKAGKSKVWTLDTWASDPANAWEELGSENNFRLNDVERRF